jgi:flagellar hook-associated protein 1 FlgK
MLAFSDPRRIAAALDLTPDPAPAATFAPGDGRNMLAIAGLRTQNYTFSTGSHSFTGSFDEAYQNVLTTASNKQSRAELNASVADSRLSIANTQRDQVSAVSLEEEFTTLITSQKAYQASARMIRTAQELLDELLNVL